MKIPAERHLDDLEARLAANVHATRELTSGLREDQLLWRPAPERWGVADCLEHLRVSDAQYFPGLRAAIDRAPAADPERAVYAPGLFARWFIGSVGPDGKRRLPAPKIFQPPPARADAPERFLAQAEVVSGLLQRARGVDLQGAKLRSPVTALLRFTIGEALTLMVAHQERHLKQARAVPSEPGFPD